MKVRIVGLLLISFLFSSIGCAGALKDYQAKSTDEEAIKGVLLQWEKSWNNGDEAGVLSVFSDNAQITYGYGEKKATASKKEYAGIVLERMKANPTVTVGLPEIKMTGEKAVATASLSTRGRPMSVTFEFAKTNGEWLVTRFSY